MNIFSPFFLKDIMRVSLRRALVYSGTCCLAWTFLAVAVSISFAVTYSLRPSHPCDGHIIRVSPLKGNVSSSHCLLMDESGKVVANLGADTNGCSACERHFHSFHSKQGQTLENELNRRKLGENGENSYASVVNFNPPWNFFESQTPLCGSQFPPSSPPSPPFPPLPPLSPPPSPLSECEGPYLETPPPTFFPTYPCLGYYNETEDVFVWRDEKACSGYTVGYAMLLTDAEGYQCRWTEIDSDSDSDSDSDYDYYSSESKLNTIMGFNDSWTHYCGIGGWCLTDTPLKPMERLKKCTSEQSLENRKKLKYGEVCSDLDLSECENYYESAFDGSMISFCVEKGLCSNSICLILDESGSGEASNS
jgi:hypothetical protein